MFLDHPVAWLPLDDPLHVCRLVISSDDESPGVFADTFVLSDRERSNPLQTFGVRTLTDQAVEEFGIGGSRRELLADLGDSFVNVTEQSLVFGESSKASFHIGIRFRLNPLETRITRLAEGRARRGPKDGARAEPLSPRGLVRWQLSSLALSQNMVEEGAGKPGGNDSDHHPGTGKAPVRESEDGEHGDA